jgi:hypothetical protein
MSFLNAVPETVRESDMAHVLDICKMCAILVHIQVEHYGKAQRSCSPEAIMDFSPLQHWQDGETFLTNGDDRAGLLLIAGFAGLLSIWLLPAIRAYMQRTAT